jgi:hypothetical protein
LGSAGDQVKKTCLASSVKECNVGYGTENQCVSTSLI